LELKEYLARKEMERRLPRAFMVVVSGVKIPQNFHKTIKDPDL